MQNPVALRGRPASRAGWALVGLCVMVAAGLARAGHLSSLPAFASGLDGVAALLSGALLVHLALGAGLLGVTAVGWLSHAGAPERAPAPARPASHRYLN